MEFNETFQKLMNKYKERNAKAKEGKVDVETELEIMNLEYWLKKNPQKKLAFIFKRINGVETKIYNSSYFRQ